MKNIDVKNKAQTNKLLRKNFKHRETSKTIFFSQMKKI